MCPASSRKSAAKPVAKEEKEEEEEEADEEEEPQEVATQQLPVNFGKRLAHTDKLVRDRGFKTLKKWLRKHSELSRLEYMKLWKGLFFGMWMADKRPVQQDLMVQTALLLEDVPREKQMMWVDAFWETMQEGWEKLDQHRIHKYLLFLRIVVAEAFKTLRVSGWEEEKVRAMGETFLKGVPRIKYSQDNVSLGLLLQFTHVFWEELEPQLATKPPAGEEVVMLLLEPFCALVEITGLRSLERSIHKNLFLKAPTNVVGVLAARLLDGAGRAEVQHNRQAMYDTADALEGTPGKRSNDGKGEAKIVRGVGLIAPLRRNASASNAPLVPGSTTTGKKTKRGGKKRKKTMTGNAVDIDSAGKETSEAESSKTKGNKKTTEATAVANGGKAAEEAAPSGKVKTKAGKSSKKASAIAAAAASDLAEAAENCEFPLVLSPLMLPKSAVPLGARNKKRKRPDAMAAAKDLAAKAADGGKPAEGGIGNVSKATKNKVKGATTKALPSPPSPVAAAAALEAGEGVSLLKKKKRKTVPGDAATVEAPSTSPRPRRSGGGGEQGGHVAFDMGATEVVKFRQQSRISSNGPQAGKEGQRRSALRKGGDGTR